MARRFPTRVFHGVFVLVAALASVISLSSVSRADSVITSSLALPSVGVANIFGVGLAEAQIFRTDNHRYELTSLVARVGNQDGAILPFANLRAHDATTNTPVTGKTNFLTSFAVPDLTGPLSDRSFTPNAPVILEANTRYWFVLGTLSDNTTNYDWAFSSSAGPITGPGGIPARFAETLDEGDSWAGFNDTPYLLEVRGNLIVATAPEPSAFSLFVSGLFVSGLLAVAGLPAPDPLTRRNAVRK